MAHRARYIFLPFIAALTLLYGCDQEAPVAEEAPRPIRTTVVKAEPLVGQSLAGVVQARVETDLGFRTLGRVLSRKVDVGDLVRQGDLLAEIDPLALRLAVTSARADVSNASAQLENARLTEERKRALAERNASSVADLEVAELSRKSAQASVARTRASLDKALEQLGYAKLMAEFDGVVTSTSVQVGQIVTAGETVLTLAKLGQRDVVVDIPESQFGALRLGDRFNVASQLDDTIRTSGILREIGPEADANTRTHRLKIAINGAPEAFRLGSLVTVTATTDHPDNVILVPASAILEKAGTASVWIVDMDKHAVSLRAVQTEAQQGEHRNIRIVSGLSAGDVIATAGVHELSEGQIVGFEKERRP